MIILDIKIEEDEIYTKIVKFFGIIIYRKAINEDINNPIGFKIEKDE